MSGTVVRLDPDDPAQVRAAAELHAELLGHSPIPRLGFLFMTRFFYSQLVKDGLIHCLLYHVDGKYVGFLSFTERPFSFMREGQRRHPVRLALILGAAVLAHPGRLRILLETATAGRREAPPDADSTGEFLSFGVLEQYVTMRTDARGRRISTVLFDEGIEHFRAKGFRRIEWNVDKENIGAIAFYRAYGATFEKSALAWPSDYRVRLVL